jgi:hypothetical protein
MTPNRQSPALALFACHRYPAAQQIRHRRHQRQSIFANGVDQETEPDAAIPPKAGAPGHAVFACPGVERMAAHN